MRPIIQRRRERGNMILAALIAGVIVAIGGMMIVSMVVTSYDITRRTLERTSLNGIAEAVAERLARDRLAERRAGFIVVTEAGIAFDDPNAQGPRFRYVAETTADQSVRIVHVTVYPSTPARGNYAHATAASE